MHSLRSRIFPKIDASSSHEHSHWSDAVQLRRVWQEIQTKTGTQLPSQAATMLTEDANSSCYGKSWSDDWFWRPKKEFYTLIIFVSRYLLITRFEVTFHFNYARFRCTVKMANSRDQLQSRSSTSKTSKARWVIARHLLTMWLLDNRS